MSEHSRPVAIVTGAGSGIGQQSAIDLARRGYSVVLVARDQAKLRKTAELVSSVAKSGVTTLVYPCDVGGDQAIRKLVSDVLTQMGRIDAIANVAGYAPLQPMEEITPELWRQCIDTNLSAIVSITAAVWPEFKRRRAGVIVNVSSMASVDPFPQFSIYAAAKAGVNMFTHCTAQEGQGLGIKAVAVAPGAVNTPMLRSLWDESKLPNNKTLAPEQVAEVIADCITGKRQFTNGQTILLPSP